MSVLAGMMSEGVNSDEVGILEQAYELYPKKVNIGTLTEFRFETVIHEYLVKQTKFGILAIAKRRLISFGISPDIDHLQTLI
jgi:hypothetical protein